MEHTLILYLANALWRTPLVAIGAAVVDRYGGLRARTRHHFWLAVLVLAIVLPAIPGAQAWRGAPPPLVAAGTPAVGGAPIFAAKPEVRPRAGFPVQLTLTPRAADLIALTFTAVAGLGLMRLGLAMMAAEGIARRSRRFMPAPALADGLWRAAGGRARDAPRVRISSEIASPVVVGVFRPAVLVPEGFAALPPDEQRAALLHEFAHVARGDYAINLAVELVSLPISWHPAAQVLKSGARRSRELACDAIAADAMTSRVAYARCLLALARRLTPGETRPVVLVGLIGTSKLEERLMHLVKADAHAGGIRRCAAGAAAGALLIPAIWLQAAPAFADVAAPVQAAPAAAPQAATAAAVARVEANPAHRRSRPRVVRLATSQETPPPVPAPPSPPAPPEPPTLATPATPAAPAAPAVDATAPALAEQREIGQIVRRAVEESMQASNTLQSPEMQKSLAELRAHAATMTQEERAQLKAEIHQQVQAALAQAHRALDSEHFRQEIRDAVKAARQARRSVDAKEP